MVVSEEICAVSVCVGVKLKMRGCLSVSEGDVVTLMEAQNVEPGMIVCRAAGETGKVPRNAVLLDQHCWNVYLEALPLLVRYPAWLERMVEAVPAADMVQMLAAKGLLREALATLFRREVADKAARHLVNETFRQESPAMALTSALLALPAVRACFREAVGVAASRVAAARGELGPRAVADVLEALFAQLAGVAEHAPPELVLLMQTLRRLDAEAGGGNWQASVFFLRCLCPALVQPVELGGLPAVDYTVAQGLMRVAKAVQVVANRLDPPPGSLAEVGDRLRLLYPVAAAFFDKMSRGSAVIHVPGVLVSQAAALYAVLCDQIAPSDDVEQQDLDSLRMRLGPPRTADFLAHAAIQELRDKLSRFKGVPI